jgi:H+-transporting ATPase
MSSDVETGPNGLTEQEVRERLEADGYNELPEKETNPVLRFLSYFWGPIPWMIEAAAALSAAVGNWTDFTIISVLLMANSLVGFWEEHKAGNAVAALRRKLALQARVKRDGKWMVIPGRELVREDLIRVRLGDIVPADAKLLAGDPVEVDQSALTGESLPVSRKAGEEIYSGSILRVGESDAVVTATGPKTLFGKTAQMVQEARTTSHFQRAVLKIGDYLIVIAAAFVILILIVALFRHDSVLTTLRFALVLTVAAIPVAMPTVLSVTMAVGATLLSRKQAIVTRLASVEEMAGIDVLCSDKTGTLTQNKLEIGEPFVIGGGDSSQIVLAAALASHRENNDPIDLAILSGLRDKNNLETYRVTHFQPFDPVHKRTEADVSGPGGKAFRVTKGAPQVVLQLSDDGEDVRPEVEKHTDEFAKRGFR